MQKLSSLKQQTTTENLKSNGLWSGHSKAKQHSYFSDFQSVVFQRV